MRNAPRPHYTDEDQTGFGYCWHITDNIRIWVNLYQARHDPGQPFDAEPVWRLDIWGQSSSGRDKIEVLITEAEALTYLLRVRTLNEALTMHGRPLSAPLPVANSDIKEAA